MSKAMHEMPVRGLAVLAAVTAFLLSDVRAIAAEVVGNVQGAGSPIAGSTVTLYAATTGAPQELAQGKTDADGAFKLSAKPAPADSVLYVIAKGGTPKAAVNKGASDTIALLTVLGTSAPRKVTVNEFTTVASVWTCAQFLKGEVLSGKQLGLRIAAGNVGQLRRHRDGRLWRRHSGRAEQCADTDDGKLRDTGRRAGRLHDTGDTRCVQPFLCGCDGPRRQCPD